MRFRSILALLSASLLATCDSSPAASSDNPLPALISIDPELVLLGSTSASVAVTGDGFIAGSRARLDGQDRETSVADAKHLTVTLTNDDLKTGHEAVLTVVNGPPGGG